MKTIATLPGIILLATTLSCQKSNDPIDNSYQPITLDSKSAEVVAANNQFGFNLLKELSKADNDNILISPLSVSEALSMTWNGATGQTASEIAETLGYNLGTANVNLSTFKIRESLLDADATIDLSIANSNWINELCEINPSFKDSLSQYYNAQCNSFNDFDEASSLKAINGWVNDKTNGKIPKILDQINSDNVMFLINAIYFKGQWKYKFEKDNTTQMTFTNQDQSTTQIEMMNQTSNFNYAEDNYNRTLEIPYGNGHFALIVLLPKQDLNTSLNQLTNDEFDNLTTNMSTKNIHLFMPKIKITYSEKLKPALNNIGLLRAFTDQAEFPYLVNNTSSLKISEVIHKTLIEVNEEGTEAAAVTSVEVVCSSAGAKPSYPEFKIDKPFLYFIKEQDTGAILFAGKVTKL